MSFLVLFSIAVAVAAALLLVPMVRVAAISVGFVDRPDRQRKLQTRPIALGGGLAVFLAFTIAFVATNLIDREWYERSLGGLALSWHLLLIASAATLVLGLFDDAWGLRGRQKMLLQCLIIAIMLGGGTMIRAISLFGIEIQLGFLAFPITMLWLLICVNALNLIDGADGMASTAAISICIGLGVLGLVGGNPVTTIAAFALAGSLFGFLLFNRPPATIYLGDAGSMMIGLLVGVFAITSHGAGSSVLTTAAVAILVIPLLDSSAAIARRWLTGRSLYVTDRGHMHHLLQKKFGPVKMLWLVGLLGTVTALLSVVSVSMHAPWVAGVGVALVLSLLVLTRSFGHAEARLVVNRTIQFVESFLIMNHQCESTTQQRRISLQGDGPWDTVWEPLVEYAQKNGLAKIKIDVNLAWLQEGYHANWQSVRLPEKAFQLRVSVPLLVTRPGSNEAVVVGEVQVIAPGNDSGSRERAVELLEYLADLSPQIEQVVWQLEEELHPFAAANEVASMVEPVGL